VHNRHVVDTLAKAGAVFVDETDEVPEGAIVVFSAHGVAPTVHASAAERSLRVIDATCPLVTKVHNEAKRFARDDYDILLIGHEGHEEVVGTAGEAPDHVQLVDGPGAVDQVTVRDENKVIWLSQTTLSVDGPWRPCSGCVPGSRNCRIRRATTSATQPRIGRSRSRRWRRSASW
jgi:4-hydroxy-3-methylbut-2-en-1-yl diphosphate reductase